MTHSRNGKIGLAAVAAVALAAAGAALAANRIHHRSASSSAGGGAIVPSSLADYANGTGTAPRTDGMRRHGGDDLAAAAAYLGISESDLATQLRSGKTLAQIASATSGKTTAGLIDALVAHEQTELTQAVKDGHLTQAQADTITAGLKTRITAMVNGQMPAHGPGFGHGPGGHDRGGLTAAAAYLGISESDLATQLRSGKTLAQIASATSGKTTAGLIDALVAHEQTELAQAVKDGHLTQAQADTITADLKTRITAMVNGQMPAHGPGFGHGPGDGDGDGDGPPGAGTPDGGSAAPSTHI